MKLTRPIALILLWLAASALHAVPVAVPMKDLVPEERHQQATNIILREINKNHYKARAVDDALSSDMFERYLEALDINRSYLTQQDIEQFDPWRTHLDEALKTNNLSPAFEIYRTYRKRVEARIEKALEFLAGEFDFSLKESYQFNREDAPWAADEKELDEIWRKRVKNDFLALKLTGKDPDKIRETLTQRYEGIARRATQLDASDVYQLFINAYTLSVEPHTSYMPPRDAENFDIGMRLSLEGIGAVLRTENEYTVVQRVIKGGPAATSRELSSGDRIVGVGQDRDGQIEDVVGWRLQDVVDRIRGPKDTVVRLQILPENSGSDGPGKIITLVRNKIKLEDQAAKSRVLEAFPGLEGLRIGVIEVPTFYRDFQGFSRGDKNFKSTTRDVRGLLSELNQQKVDGVIIDLRGNGGGSLTEATELTGLFIPTGPVVQVRKSNGELEIEEDRDPEVAYNGPLAVLVDRFSASASEIFAGAIQDYGRGIIIGETTFGKGTVQSLMDLDHRSLFGSNDLGRLRFTMAQFFRVSGSSTQFKGVVPDVRFPTDEQNDKEGERSLDNALPWASIDAADFKRVSTQQLDWLQARSDLRTATDPGFRYLLAEEAVLGEARDETSVSLNEKERKTQWESRKQARLDRRNSFRQSVGLPPEMDEDDEEDTTRARADEDEDPETKAIRDIGLHEGALVLQDLIRKTRPRSAMVE